MRRLARLLPILLVSALVLPVAAEQRGGRGLTVYEDAGFRGRSREITGEVRSLRSVGMNDRVSSFEIPRGEQWEFCEDDDFRGRCEVFSRDEIDLADSGMNDRISSIRRVGGGFGGFGNDRRRDDDRRRGDYDRRDDDYDRRGDDRRGGWGGGGGPRGGRLELFEDTRFDGKSIALEEPARELGSMDMRAESLRLSGTWEICDRPDFRGRCMTVSRNISNLDDIGWKERIRSARPR